MEPTSTPNTNPQDASQAQPGAPMQTPFMNESGNNNVVKIAIIILIVIALGIVAFMTLGGNDEATPTNESVVQSVEDTLEADLQAAVSADNTADLEAIDQEFAE